MQDGEPFSVMGFTISDREIVEIACSPTRSGCANSTWRSSTADPSAQRNSRLGRAFLRLTTAVRPGPNDHPKGRLAMIRPPAASRSYLPRLTVPRLTAGVAALALAGIVSSGALAAAPYTVKVTAVPSVVPKLGHVTLTASGLSSNASRLTVFIDPHSCAITAKAENLRPKAVKTISHVVVHKYTRTRLITTKVQGVRFVCAYLTAVAPSPPLSLQYAVAGTRYVVTP